MDLPRVKICERAFVLAVAAACATDADSMLAMAVVALGIAGTNRRMIFSTTQAFALRD
jgi:hypothetical protein